MAKGQVMKGIGGFYTVFDQDTRKTVTVRARGRLKGQKGIKDKIYIGDFVSYDPEAMVITDIDERKTVLKKPPIANIDEVIVVFSGRKPQFHYPLLTKFLLLAGREKIPHIVVCMTKWDLVGEEERKTLLDLLATLPYPVICTSSKTGQGLDEVKEALSGHVSVFTGPSGVGKSSLMNSLFQELNLEVGSLSEKIERGKHTTRHVELIRLQENTLVADTPGFGYVEYQNILPEELKEYFAEFKPYEGLCKFRGCLHQFEPECEIKKQLETGNINKIRYQTYIELLEELKEVRREW